MAKHRAPEEASDTSVVQMAPARHLRLQTTVGDAVRRDTAQLDLTAPGVFVDDLTLIAADDQLLDCIAAGRGDVFVGPPEFSSGFPAGSLAPLLATWRLEIIDPQWPSLPTDEQVDEAVKADVRPIVRPARRALRPMIGVAVTISTLLFSSAAVGAQSAKPGDVLWPLTRVLYTDRFDSFAAGDAARGSLKSADLALKSHNPTSAKIALTSAQQEMSRVKLPEVRTPLESAYATLMSRASVAETESKQSAAKSVAAAAGAGSTGTAVAPGPAVIKTARSGPTTGGKPVVTTSGRAEPTSRPGVPVVLVPTVTTPVRGNGAPVTVPANPTDIAPTPTGPTVPQTSGPSVPPGTTAPVTTDPGTTDAATTDPGTTGPVTTGPVTTDPVTTDPGTDPNTDPATTEASTTSQLPTPTLPDETTGNSPGDAASIETAAVQSQ